MYKIIINKSLSFLNRFSNLYLSLLPKTVQSFKQVLSSNFTPGTLYGALLGFNQIPGIKGEEVLKYLKEILDKIETWKNGELFVEGNYCYSILIVILYFDLQQVIQSHQMKFDEKKRNFPTYESFNKSDFNSFIRT